MKYAFLLGREPLLSVAELQAVFGESSVTQVIGNVAFVETSGDPIEMFKRLGGSIKLGKILQAAKAADFAKDPLDMLTAGDFLKGAFGVETSLAIAISFLGNKPKGLQKTAKNIGIEWKKVLKEKYAHVRFVESRDPVTSSVTVTRNKLLRGCDLWIVGSGEEIFFIKTIAVQDYQDFSERDFGRPRRNAKNGMLPPKLARMMVNIAGVNESSIVYDPFAGSGTVLQEALLVGVKKMYGSDISQGYISDAQKNLQWISEISKKSADVQLFASDIQSVDVKKVFDVTTIVTEIDLGDPLTGLLSPGSAKKSGEEALVLASACFRLAERLPACATIVIALPFWPHRDGLSLTPLILPASYQIVIQKKTSEHFASEMSTRGGLFYIRKDQFVGREILVLKKKEIK